MLPETGELTTYWFEKRMKSLQEAELGTQYLIPSQHLVLRLQNFGDRRVAFSVELPHRPRQPESTRLFRCEVRQLRADTWSLNVIASDDTAGHRAAPVFADLAARLQSSSADTAHSVVAAVLTAWRRSFVPERELLSDERMLGLVGELTVIDQLVTLGSVSPQELMQGWTGPLGEDHDFSFAGRLQIEVKTTTPFSGRLRISNEYQLESGDVPLAIVCVRATRSTEGSGGESLLARVRATLSSLADGGAREMFREHLADLGLDISDVRYDDVIFEVTSLEVFQVAEGTPRIVPADLLPGVQKVSYEINISDLGIPLPGGMASLSFER